MHDFLKQPFDQYYIAIDFVGCLPTGASLLSGTVSAVDTSDPDTDATDDVIEGPLLIVETQARAFVMAGEDQHDYKLTFRLTLTPGSPVPQLEEDLLMRVSEI